MHIGVPREIKEMENRVGVTPAGVSELVREGHRVFVERNAGGGSERPHDSASVAAELMKSAGLITVVAA